MKILKPIQTKNLIEIRIKPDFYLPLLETLTE